MARILLSYYRGTNPGNYKDPLCFYDGLIKKLVENGNDVLAINTVNFTLWGSNKLINNKDEDVPGVFSFFGVNYFHGYVVPLKAKHK